MPDFNHFPALAEALDQFLKDAVAATAEHIRDDAKGRAHVITGYMRDNTYAATSKGSDYTGGDKSFPPLTPENDYTAYVAAAATYSIYEDMGTRYRPPHPWFTPAVDAGGAAFENELSQMEDKLRGAT